MGYYLFHHSSVEGYLACLQFGVIRSRAASFMDRFLWERKFSLFWDKFSEVQFLGNRVVTRTVKAILNKYFKNYYTGSHTCPE